MIIKEVEIENFLSIEKETVHFKESGSLLVDGFNYDTQSSNGSGKTSIFNAISYAIFEDYPRKASLTEVQRIGTKKTKVAVSLDLGDDVLYKVIRSRPGGCLFLKGEKEISSEEFYHKVKINYDQFVISQYFHQSPASFLDMSDSARKELLLKLIDLDLFCKIKQRIDFKIKETSIAIGALKNSITKIELSAESTKTLIETLLEAGGETDRVLSNIAELSSKIKDHEEEDDAPLKEKREKISKRISAMEEILAEIRIKKRGLIQKGDKIQPPTKHTCPSCAEPLMVVNGDVKVYCEPKDPSHEIEKHNEKIQEEISALMPKVERLAAFQEAKDAINEELHSRQIRSMEHKQEQKNILFKISTLESRLKELNKSKDKVKELKESLKEIKADWKVKCASLQEMEDSLINLQHASQVVSPTGIPAYLLDTIVDDLNEQIQENVRIMFPSVEYSIQTYKENKSGAVVAKISETLTIGGVKRSIGSLSGGERRCIGLAVDFSITDIVQKYLGRKISPIILDEPFEAMDERNQQLAMTLINEKSTNTQIAVISHLSEIKTQFSDIISIEKKNGTSKIIG